MDAQSFQPQAEVPKRFFQLVSIHWHGFRRNHLQINANISEQKEEYGDSYILGARYEIQIENFHFSHCVRLTDHA